MKSVKAFYVITSILLILFLNAATLFFLIARVVEVNVMNFDLEEFGNSVAKRIELLIKVSTVNGKEPDTLMLPFWELIGGWREFLVWLFMILGWSSSIYIGFRSTFKSLKNKKDRALASKQKRDELDLLKLKIKADMNMVNEKDLKQMEKSLYE